MNSKLKRFLAYSAVIALLGTGVYFKLCKDKSNAFSKRTINYINNFVDDEFSIVAHRGFSSLCIDNTISSLEKAKEAKYVDYIEMDVRLTSDNKLVLAHNNYIISKDGRFVSIDKTCLADIKEEEFKYYSINLLEFVDSFWSDTEGILVRKRIANSFAKCYSVVDIKEALEVCQDKCILLDLKFENNFDNFTPELIKMISSIPSENIILQSGDLISLALLQDMYPLFTYSAIIDDLAELDLCNSFQMLAIRKELVSKDLVNDVLDSGKMLSVWTINTTDELEDVVNSLGEATNDVIYITDYPDVVAAHLDNIVSQKKKVIQ